MNCYKITKPIERISLEMKVLRDCVTPPKGWHDLKAVPRSKRLEEHRDRWAIVDEYLADKWKFAIAFQLKINAQRAELKRRGEELPDPSPQQMERLGRALRITLTHDFLHPHDAARRWFWTKQTIDPNELKW